MRYWVIGTIAWLAFWAGFWEWSDCYTLAPGISFDIRCPATGPTYTFTLGEFVAFLAEIALLPPAVSLLAFLVIRHIVRRLRMP
jgi:hypothetical protein